MDDIKAIKSLPPITTRTRKRVEDLYDNIEAEISAGRRRNEIADAMGINRSTFYLYLRDIKRTRELIAAARAA